jgi:microcin C transport system ATP-binding protein
MSLLEVQGLDVAFGQRRVVQGVSFAVDPGETVALVGESGSGKSVTALSCLRLLPSGGHNPAGRVVLDGVDVLGATAGALQRLRGGVAGMVFQEPMTSLNPLHTVGRQVGEAITLHRPLSGDALRARIVELLTRAGFPQAQDRLGAYPHQLSGGQRQRPEAADRGRTHHGAGRHHPGADPGTAADAEARPEHGAAADHP